LSIDVSSKALNVSASSGNATLVNSTSHSQDERSEKMRARLLAASIKVVRKRGYSGFTTEMVAQTARVSRGALLHHFPRKRDLILAVQKQLYHLSMKDCDKTKHLDINPSLILDEMLSNAEDFFLGEHFFSVLDIVMSSSTEPDLKNEILAISRDFRLKIEESWVERLTKFMPRPLANDLVFMAFNIVRGYAVRTLWDDNAGRYEDMIALWKSMLADFLLRQDIELTG
tara:strand:+ start:15370 stop:16053 length:684 start_codon:yes stop_codon:yes gene_type:complete